MKRTTLSVLLVTGSLTIFFIEATIIWLFKLSWFIIMWTLFIGLFIGALVLIAKYLSSFYKSKNKETVDFITDEEFLDYFREHLRKEGFVIDKSTHAETLYFPLNEKNQQIDEKGEKKIITTTKQTFLWYATAKKEGNTNYSYLIAMDKQDSSAKTCKKIKYKEFYNEDEIYNHLKFLNKYGKTPIVNTQVIYDEFGKPKVANTRSQEETQKGEEFVAEI